MRRICLFRRRAASGVVARVGGETQVNTTEAGGQFLSAVASYANGNYVIVWADTSYTGLGSGPRSDFTQVRAQFYHQDGTKVGGEFQVSSGIDVGQNNPKVSVLSNGDFAVVWQTEGASSVGDTDRHWSQRAGVQADGTHTPVRVGSEFQVNSGTAGDQGPPPSRAWAMAVLSRSGRITALTNRRHQDADIPGQRHRYAGAVANEVAANTVTTGRPAAPIRGRPQGR